MVDYNFLYKLALSFSYSAVVTLFAVHYVIDRCKKHGYMVPDMHKWGKPKVAVLGGTAMLAGVFISLSLTQMLLFNKDDIGNLFIFYFVVMVYALYGLLDDIFHFKQRYDKVLALLILSVPIVSIIRHLPLYLFFTTIPDSTIVLFIVAPMYIMVVANLVNLHAGFNGLASGTSLILLIAAGIKSYLVYDTAYLYLLMPILGAALVFFLFNKYPAKLLEGNVGTFLLGASLGAFLIVNRFLLFGIIILIPHIITFILDTWVLSVRKVPDKQFPRPRKDGLIIPHPSMRYKSLKNVICTIWPMTERAASNVLLVITAAFAAIGVVVT